MNIAIFYGSTTGVTEDIANRIASKINAEVFSANEIGKIRNYDFSILATSTWGMGDIQDDWMNPLEELKTYNLSGKKIALIGVGDQEGFSSTFVNGLRELYNAIKDSGADIVGQTSTDGYSFDDTTAIENGKFLGLVIDENNQSNLTDERIDKWLTEIK